VASARQRFEPLAAGTTEALMLTCIDFRLPDAICSYMNRRGMKGRYDQVILAGGSLSPGSDRFPKWAETYWEHLDIALSLHKIRRVIVLDHRDCGAFRVAYDRDFGADPVTESLIHRTTLTAFRDRVLARYPDLEVELLLMGLDGQVETIEPIAGTLTA
jgi:carbonic anhydrase